MSKIHYRVYGADYRAHGQTDYEYNNQASCGFAGVKTTLKTDDVTCKLCKKKLKQKSKQQG